jgi:hypothetical protein
MLSYQVEPLTQDLISEMLKRQDDYWDEVAAPFHDFPPDVNWTFYMSAHFNGSLKVISGRENGDLKAIAFVLMTLHPHYACLCASMALLYLVPECRKGREGIRLIRFAEKTAESSGAQMILTHGGVHNSIYKVFEFMKYDDFGRYFVKVLPNGPNGLNPIFKNKGG